MSNTKTNPKVCYHDCPSVISTFCTDDGGPERDKIERPLVKNNRLKRNN